MFTRAIKKEGKMRMAISGPAGSGKTYTALAIARNFGRVAMVDTEHKSGEKYADIFVFDNDQMGPPYDPKLFIDRVKEAANQKYDIVIIDSFSHAWIGEGGLLDQLSDYMAVHNMHNSMAAWKAYGTPMQNRMINSFLETDIHIITCMREKMQYEIIEGDDKKKVVKKLGLQPIQRDDTEYEFDVYARMDQDNNFIISKTRCIALKNKLFREPDGKEISDIIKAWLVGASVENKEIGEIDASLIEKLKVLSSNEHASTRLRTYIADLIHDRKSNEYLSNQISIIEQRFLRMDADVELDKESIWPKQHGITE